MRVVMFGLEKTSLIGVRVRDDLDSPRQVAT